MTIKYKIQENNVIFRISSSTFIAPFSGSTGWEQFVDDIYTNGLGIVEGADYVGVTTYTIARAEEYPPIVDQLDKIYHSGIDAWKADIKVIKDKYPKTQVGITSIAPIPDWVNTALFEKQKEKYVEAVARLAQPRLKLGTPYIESVWDTSENKYVDHTKYKDVPIGDEPAVVSDEAERDAAQAIVDATPQSVIDSINS